MDSLLIRRPDLEFLLYDSLQVDEFARLPRFAEHSRATFGAAPAELESGMPLVLSWQTWAADTRLPLLRKRPVQSVTA